MDWSLLTCARKGHITYAPTEGFLRDRLRTPTAAGEAWRCLRCEAFVPGAPDGGGPADEAPLVPRGKALRDEIVLRLFAIERIIRVVVFVGLAAAVWEFAHNRETLQRLYNKELPLLSTMLRQLGWDPDNNHMLNSVQHLFAVKATSLTLVAAGLLGYAVIEAVEAVGLWSLKRWGEYFAVVATACGLPIEIYELTEKITVTRVGALVINLALLVYLLVSKRLFGIRGGGKAYGAGRRGQSLIEVERAAALTVAGGAATMLTSPGAPPGPSGPTGPSRAPATVQDMALPLREQPGPDGPRRP